MNVTGLISAALLAALVFCVPARPAAADAPPRTGWMEQFTLNDPPLPVPDTPFANAGGKPARLADFSGRVVLVNFWATWCAPCIRELPSLDRLQAAFDGKDLVVLAVNEDRGGAGIAAPFLAKLGLERLALYIDDRLSLARALGLRGMPASFLVDRKGRIVGSLTGPAEWDSAEAKALIGYYLDRPR